MVDEERKRKQQNETERKKKLEKVEWGVNQVENRKEQDKERKNRSRI